MRLSKNILWFLGAAFHEDSFGRVECNANHDLSLMRDISLELIRVIKPKGISYSNKGSITLEEQTYYLKPSQKELLPCLRLSKNTRLFSILYYKDFFNKDHHYFVNIATNILSQNTLCSLIDSVVNLPSKIH